MSFHFPILHSFELSLDAEPGAAPNLGESKLDRIPGWPWEPGRSWKVLRSAGYSAAIFEQSQKLIETPGSRKGHQHLWEGPIARLIFVQFLKTDIRPLLFFAVTHIVVKGMFCWLHPQDHKVLVCATTTHTNNMMFDFTERPRMIHCFVHRCWNKSMLGFMD